MEGVVSGSGSGGWRAEATARSLLQETADDKNQQKLGFCEIRNGGSQWQLSNGSKYEAQGPEVGLLVPQTNDQQQSGLSGSRRAHQTTNAVCPVGSVRRRETRFFRPFSLFSSFSPPSHPFPYEADCRDLFTMLAARNFSAARQCLRSARMAPSFVTSVSQVPSTTCIPSRPPNPSRPLNEHQLTDLLSNCSCAVTLPLPPMLSPSSRARRALMYVLFPAIAIFFFPILAGANRAPETHEQILLQYYRRNTDKFCSA